MPKYSDYMPKSKPTKKKNKLRRKKRVIEKVIGGISKVGEKITKTVSPHIPKGHKEKVVRTVTELILGPKTYLKSEEQKRSDQQLYTQRRSLRRAKSKLKATKGM